MSEVTMPRLSDTMEEGIVSAWLKQVGDQVKAGEILAEIETDKALMELEAYEDGILEAIIAEPGTTVAIGEPIALLGDGSGASAAPAAALALAAAAPAPAAAPAAPAAAAAPAISAPAAGNGSTPTESGDRKKSSPLARKVAKEIGVDINAVNGTGPGGRVTKQDVENAGSTATPAAPAAAAAAPAATPAAVAPATGDYEEIPLTNIQRVSATRLTESKQQAPHIYLTSAIDVTELLAFRAQINNTLEETGSGKVSVNDLLVKAVATALRLDPAVNVSFAGDKLLRHKAINIGIAVATDAGLFVPVIHDADRKSVSAIAAEGKEKAGRARDRKLKGEDMSGGTFTISNLGMFGIEQFTAVINPPESAILAVGAAQDELKLDGEKVVSRKILRVTLSADHRSIDGAVAARFLQQLKELIEHPLRIVT
ncbi:dihydrolipoamide acetyltransferase family protein [Nocardia seriolae]|uniref:Dihydrolipoamide acetyltransferase component of pyruvate dehydrogenase complex n=2 Tax=Nocardia seriolae TaxID=37332 RepID=A0ABC8AT34_9NOCA|nr:dihydrolipoamide acetyltransferase family protein [Nocardia seriolae]APA97196.1 Dihydrolipoyllysine-residue acetyltransferase [Nocardia seriolae]QOW34150.1 2-oxo acid dehydrogenase subunit E2 [Nocardia seriolae]QUN18344.1 2-oxo acid dehydrogenase subunit E2 [Nocardia seriolae]WNJ61378.1 dihydrolipoamide acetyltransferase family protein [Nocardia seriolae]BEK97441.1 pyruvate dehydrogenase complex dihydrolipoamide acetyltransferase [Nocardia seriolae]